MNSPESSFISPISEREVYVDSSENGWGALILGQEFFGTLDSLTIGKSSTFRELQGFRLLLDDVNFGKLVQGRTTRFNMDSKGAVANLIHSGPVRELAPLVQSAWKKLEEMKVHPIFRWVSRETSQLSDADRLSKQVSDRRQLKSLIKWEEELNCDIVQVNHNQIANKIAEIVVTKYSCALLVPKWEGKSWWQVLTSETDSIVPVPYNHIKFSRSDIFPKWDFVLGIFVF
jgi:hypothetical protein